MRIVAYHLMGHPVTLRPAPLERDWMSASPQKFAYRCLPLNIANMHGWELLSPVTFWAEWDGGDALEAVRIEANGPAELHPTSHFGCGVLTFSVPLLFRTPPGVNLLVTGPFNRIRHGIQALTGIVETDWAPYTFTMNWRFTAPGTRIWWEKDEPIAMLFPVPRGYVEAVEPEMLPIEDAPQEQSAYHEWRTSRLEFNKDLKQADSPAHRRGWQKNYFQGRNLDGSPGNPEHQTKLAVKPWRRGGD
jgi:hypothetical protein